MLPLLRGLALPPLQVIRRISRCQKEFSPMLPLLRGLAPVPQACLRTMIPIQLLAAAAAPSVKKVIAMYPLQALRRNNKFPPTLPIQLAMPVFSLSTNSLNLLRLLLTDN
jgi:hypothetical protein